jgi:response regulator of citrate/malate metabolism
MVAHINKKFTEKVPPFKVVGTSFDSDDAIEKIKELKPDLLLLDIYLPQKNGLYILQEIRQQNIPIDVIMVTAAKDTATIHQALRFGAVDYLIKPFDFERLQQALCNYLNLRQLMDKNLNLSQEELDKLNSFNLNTINTATILQKKVHQLTLDQITNFLLEQNQPLSCQQIASALAISKVTVWRYLEYLADKGNVKIQLESTGFSGRPTKLYSIAPTNS